MSVFQKFATAAELCFVDAEHFELEKWYDTSYLHKANVDPTDTI